MIRSALVACLVLLASPGIAADPVEVKPSPQKVLSAPNGRFVFGQISDFRADQFLLDTQTGRLWQIVVDKEGAKKLQPISFVQIIGDEAYIPDTLQEAENHKSYIRKKMFEQLNK